MERQPDKRSVPKINGILFTLFPLPLALFFLSITANVLAALRAHRAFELATWFTTFMIHISSIQPPGNAPGYRVPQTRVLLLNYSWLSVAVGLNPHCPTFGVVELI